MTSIAQFTSPGHCMSRFPIASAVVSCLLTERDHLGKIDWLTVAKFLGGGERLSCHTSLRPSWQGNTVVYCADICHIETCPPNFLLLLHQSLKMQAETGVPTQLLTADKPYKWIRQEIEQADAYKDYVQIFRLSMEYVGDSRFMDNLMYSITFSNFVINDWGAEAVWRKDGGKVLHNPTERMYETILHNSTWWYYGPHHPRTKESVAMINKRHQNYAKKFPGNFSHAADYLYTLCFSAALVHRFRLRLQLSGFSRKQKIAAHLCLKELAKLFLVEQPGKPEENWVPLLTVARFPEDWDGIVAFCEDVENNHSKITDAGHMVAEALFDHFAYCNFPPLLRPLGRAIPIALSNPQLLVAHRIKPVNPVLARVIIFAVGTFIWFMETFLPDPKIATQEAIQERARTRKAQHREDRRILDKGFPHTFAQHHQGAAATCPFIVKQHDS
jgi:hypothetical protein